MVCPGVDLLVLLPCPSSGPGGCICSRTHHRRGDISPHASLCLVAPGWCERSQTGIASSFRASHQQPLCSSGERGCWQQAVVSHLPPLPGAQLGWEGSSAAPSTPLPFPLGEHLSPLTLPLGFGLFAGASYFFRGKEYWKVLDSELEVQPGYPQSIARDWLVCSDMQSDSPEAAGSSRTGARSKPGQHDESRSENGYEVCSCTSASPSLRACPVLRLSASVMLVSLWTAALVCAAL